MNTMPGASIRMHDVNCESNNELFLEQIDACRHCSGGPSESADDPPARCLLCERYFEKGRLFLNNVG